MSSSQRKVRRSARKRKQPAASWNDKNGRRHLTLVGDSAIGTERFELIRPVFADAWQNSMVLAAANTSYALLCNEKSIEAVVSLGRQAMKATSDLVTGLLDRAPTGSISCKQGCAHCCHQSVGITPPEAIIIHQYLLETLDENARALTLNKLTRAYETTQGLTAEQRLSPQLPCPFLEHDSCSIYEVRPLSCRAMHSTDERACFSKLHDPVARQTYFAGKMPGHSFNEPTQALHAISAGLQLSLSEHFQLDMRPLDLSSALYLLLKASSQTQVEVQLAMNPVERWLGGEPALEPALGGEVGTGLAQANLKNAIGALDYGATPFKREVR